MTGWHRIWSIVVLALGWMAALPSVQAADDQPIVGDAGLTVHQAWLSTYYETMPEWAQAGCSAGIPARPSDGVTVEPGGDIQAAIDALADAGGVVRLAEGAYDLSAPLRVPSQTLLLGAGREQTIIRFPFDHMLAADDQPVALALAITDAEGWGVADLTFASQAAVREAAGPPPPPHHTRDRDNAPRYIPPAVRIDDAAQGWMDRVSIELAPGDALHVTASEHLTLRALFLDGTLHRGVGHGRFLLRDVHHLLIHALRAHDMRRLECNGPMTHCVFKEAVLGVGVEFHQRAGQIEHNLFEDIAIIVPPAYPFRPFTTWLVPLGEGNTCMDVRGYHHGTDAIVSGIIPEPGVPYLFAPRRQRPGFDPFTLEMETVNQATSDRPNRIQQVYRHQTTITRSESLMDNVEPIVIAPLAADATDDMPISSPGSRRLIDDWLLAGPVAAEHWDRGIEAVMAGDWAGVGGQAFGGAATFSELPDEIAPNYGEVAVDDAHSFLTRERYFVQYMRHGREAGRPINLLRAAGGWNGVIALHQMWRIEGNARVRILAEIAGGRWQCTINGTAVTADDVVDLQAGLYSVVWLLQAHRRAPMERQARYAFALQLLPLTVERTVVVETPSPPAPTLYPIQAGTHPDLAADLAAADVFFEFYAVITEPSVPGLRDRLDSFLADHSGTVAASTVMAIQAIVLAAPTDESAPEDMTADQVAELSYFYKTRGLLRRYWSLGRFARDNNLGGGGDRHYYFDAIQE